MNTIIQGKIQHKQKQSGTTGGIQVQVVNKANTLLHVFAKSVADKDGNYQVAIPPSVRQSDNLLFLQILDEHSNLLEEKAIGPKSGHAKQLTADFFIKGKKVSAPVQETVQGKVSIAPRKFEIRKEGEFDIPYLEGFSHTAITGEPMLLQQVQYTLLPKGSRVTGMKIEPGIPVAFGENVKPKIFF